VEVPPPSQVTLTAKAAQLGGLFYSSRICYTQRKYDCLFITILLINCENYIKMAKQSKEQATVAKKRFIIAKSMIGQNLKVEVETRTGNKFTYDHDQIYRLFKDKFDNMPCFQKYHNYTNSDNLPKFVREALTKK